MSNYVPLLELFTFERYISIQTPVFTLLSLFTAHKMLGVPVDSVCCIDP